ncbi:hypothetical protein PM082_006987 [Marasmius tenuissimus]|nr:hypothetical protein PM082_006987 [Marasmius tenuissimus]
MKLSTLFTALLPVAAVLAQEPTFYSGTPLLEDRELDKRAITGTVLVDGLRHRTCPRTSCPAPGQYAKGTKISIVCYTRDDTTVVEGDPGWALTNGNWVALAYGKYVYWDAPIPYC